MDNSIFSSNVSSNDPPHRRLRSIPKRLFSVEQSAHYLGLSKYEVYDMIKDGTLPHVRRGRRKLVDKQDLDAWIEKNKEGGDV